MHKITKTMALSALSLCIYLLPFSSKAANLVIDNQTFFPSTSQINNQSKNAQCSKDIPDYGITPPHTKNTIPSGIVFAACLANLKSCTAEVHMSNDCTGPIIATVVFDFYNGIKSIANNYGPRGFIIANPPRSPFYVDIMGGPAA